MPLRPYSQGGAFVGLEERGGVPALEWQAFSTQGRSVTRTQKSRVRLADKSPVRDAAAPTHKHPSRSADSATVGGAGRPEAGGPLVRLCHQPLPGQRPEAGPQAKQGRTLAAMTNEDASGSKETSLADSETARSALARLVAQNCAGSRPQMKAVAASEVSKGGASPPPCQKPHQHTVAPGSARCPSQQPSPLTDQDPITSKLCHHPHPPPERSLHFPPSGCR